MNINKNITEIIGKTPLLELCGLEKEYNTGCTLCGKLEYLNPAGSIKDRTALFMIRDAEMNGSLKPGGVIIEPTSGNTGIGIAAIASVLGYKTVIVMPDSMSEERCKILRAYGAVLELTPGKNGMKGAIARANELHAEIPGSIIAGQFENPSNPKAHFMTTGPEIWEQTDGKVDLLVCGVGTGGTVTGAGKFLKSKNPGIKIIGVEPSGSPVLSGGAPGAHGLQGIGAGFIPDALDVSVLDEVITVCEKEAYDAARVMARRDGILCGISSGAAAAGAVRVCSRPENRNSTAVIILPDTGDRYLSTELFL